MRDRRIVIEVRDIAKSFRIPEHRIDSLKERAVHPFTRVEYREHRALSGISFDVREGEFFGIVGRNGSGKSSLLKILAGIYKQDAGSVRMAGRVAPFIELGVGFNTELTARENALLNGVLMGLTLREARYRLDSILEFAELEEFVDLKLKNYSSGMLVRLAFAIMVQADADIMLIDEVLAVGDAAFSQKCLEVFYERRRSGKTIVLVTHDMAMVQSLCHRGMVIHDGELDFLGDPEDTALRYLKLNSVLPRAGETAVELDLCARVVRARLRGGVDGVAAGAPIDLDVLLEAARPLERPSFIFHVVTSDGVVVVGFTRTLEDRVAPGQRVRMAGRIENRLVAGVYFVNCYVREDRPHGGQAVQGLRLIRFSVTGSAPRDGLVAVDADLEPALEVAP